MCILRVLSLCICVCMLHVTQLLEDIFVLKAASAAVSLRFDQDGRCSRQYIPACLRLVAGCLMRLVLLNYFDLPRMVHFMYGWGHHWLGNSTKVPCRAASAEQGPSAWLMHCCFVAARLPPAPWTSRIFASGSVTGFAMCLSCIPLCLHVHDLVIPSETKNEPGALGSIGGLPGIDSGCFWVALRGRPGVGSGGLQNCSGKRSHPLQKPTR